MLEISRMPDGRGNEAAAWRPWLAWIGILIAPCLAAEAQDTVILRISDRPTERNGRVVEYSAAGLVLERPDGRRQSYPADQVVSVRSEKTAAHLAADESFDLGRFAQAVDQYREAKESEKRRWVWQQMTVRRVWCYRALRQVEWACQEFVLLPRLGIPISDEQMACIPLAWTAGQPSETLQSAAVQWLGYTDDPVVALLGASHLLMAGSRSSEALARLKQLATAADSRVAQLAQAQIWRTVTPTAGPAPLDTWSRLIEQIPEPLRAGPYYVLGHARTNHKQHEQAALALLRVPILYPRHGPLAARALAEAGQNLQQLGRPLQAAQLYREAIAADADPIATAEARSRLKLLTEKP